MNNGANKKSFIFAGGGTGGHLYPAIAIGQRLLELEPEAQIHFIGTDKGLENRVIPEMGYPLHKIAVRGFSRKNLFANVGVIIRLIYSLFQCVGLLKKIKPLAVIGTGGYVSGPMLFTANLMGYPTLIQEQNSYPGVTTRLLAKKVEQVHLSFKESFKFFKNQKNLHLTGNPVRKFDLSIGPEKARSFFNLAPEKLTVLIFGGSQGALAINKAFANSIDRVLAETDAQFIWLSGKYSFEMAKQSVKGHKSRIYLTEYLDNMNMAYNASDLATSRAGAIALSELAICGLPSILIPYPFAAADHQSFNAQTFEKAGAALVLTETEIENNTELFANTIVELINNKDKRVNMSQAAKKVSFPDSVDKLAESITLISKQGNR